MHVSVERDDDPALPVVMRVTGEVDVLTSSTLRRELTLHMSARRRDLVVDLSGVTFMDSTGLGVLIRAERQLHERGSRMALVVDHARIVDLLRITALEKVFEVHRSVQDATSMLTGEA
jgi:anti-sigma B factor antagonist